MRIAWSPRAIGEAQEIADYIAAERPGAATMWLRGLGPAVSRLASFPRSGRVLEASREDTPEQREVLYGTYRIIYRILPDRIEILAVVHTRRDQEEEDAP
ncbi:MAG: plasmid stabilization system [Gemmatimonadetes bacterium]|nr:plasmid stabilization system [Gemmatimonadota bacterium]